MSDKPTQTPTISIELLKTHLPQVVIFCLSWCVFVLFNMLNECKENSHTEIINALKSCNERIEALTEKSNFASAQVGILEKQLKECTELRKKSKK